MLGLVRRETVEQRGEVVAGEVPVEGFGDLVPVVLEVVQGAGEVGEAVEVVRLEDLALDDRVVDLELVEPAGVDREVDEEEVLLPPRNRSRIRSVMRVVIRSDARRPMVSPIRSPASAVRVSLPRFLRFWVTDSLTLRLVLSVNVLEKDSEAFLPNSS